MSQELLEQIKSTFDAAVKHAFLAADGVVTMETSPELIISVAQRLHDEPQFDFKLLVDVCGIDYSTYGQVEWRTHETTLSGFSRGKEYSEKEDTAALDMPRFAVLYNLVSLSHNQRLRIRVFLDDRTLKVPSVCSIWNSANWPERETFDLFGVVFEGHPDMRRLLTDYGFVGHPFRKDFPLIGEVELRYDAEQERCVYEAVSIQPRVTVPRVIRHDNRYVAEKTRADEKEK